MAEDQLSRRHLRVATYNVHDCVGRDGVYAPDRIAAVVAGLDADVVALQEVTLDHAGEVVGLLEAKTGTRAIDGTLFDRGIGRYGNLLLCRPGVRWQRLHDLTCRGREPRGAVEARLTHASTEFGVFATHLGLARNERRRQIARLAQLVGGGWRPSILMGDLNLWPSGGSLAPLQRVGLEGVAVRSFPSRPWPAFALDRILVSPPCVVVKCWRVVAPLTTMASDHLPVVADIAMGQA